MSSSPFGNSGPWCAAPKSVSVGDPGAPPVPVKSWPAAGGVVLLDPWISQLSPWVLDRATKPPSLRDGSHRSTCVLTRGCIAAGAVADQFSQE